MRFLLALLLIVLTSRAPAADKPNFVIILADDLGYSDLADHRPVTGSRDTQKI